MARFEETDVGVVGICLALDGVVGFAGEMAVDRLFGVGVGVGVEVEGIVQPC